MKIFLTTTFLVAVLGVGLLGLNNAFAQGEDNITMSIENDTSMMMNATLPISLEGNNTAKPMNSIQPTSIISNVMLAFAQEGSDTMSMGNNTAEMMGMDYDDNKMKLNGTVDVHSTIAEAFKSKVTTDIIGAIQAAQSSVGANSFVKEAELTEAHGYLIYKITAVDENMKKYKVIVDPGNGQVLMKKEVTGYDEHDKMKYGHGDESYGKYGDDSREHGYDDYDQKNMMMKDKKY